tara:strand:+ start:31 stop:573 length:543 start_codon:yes stop_codon:yes gene_type:complete
MNYQNLNKEISAISFEKKYFYSIFGLYLFSIGTTILGYSIYLLLESLGLVTKSVISWNAQGLFWFMILFSVSLFILFIPIEFLNTFKIYNLTFKDLILNIIFVILTSLLSLVFFQFFLNPSNLIMNDVIDIGKAISFSGFIAIPLILFLQHNFKRTVGFSDNLSYALTYFLWVLSSQLFL